MHRPLLAFLAAVSLASLPARAAEEILLKDEFDDKKLVLDARQRADVKAFAAVMDEFTGTIGRYKERDILALLGKPVKRRAKEYALPCSEYRGVSLSFVRHGDLDRDHAEFYKVEDLAAFEVYYDVDGVSPAAVFVYFKVDDRFTPLTQAKDLPERLAWDKERLQQLKRWFQAKRREIFEWEVDDEALKKQLEGDESPDLEEKFKAWMETGAKQGYHLHTNAGKPGEPPQWAWLEGDRTFVRIAGVDKAWKPGRKAIPRCFWWLDEKGRVIREQTGQDYLDDFRWKRPAPDGTDIRIERGAMINGVWRPTHWVWLSPKTGGVVRQEWSDNAEVIPNRVWIRGERPGEGEESPLAMKDSWALHPDLIPKEYRIPDEERKLPIRKIQQD